MAGIQIDPTVESMEVRMRANTDQVDSNVLESPPAQARTPANHSPSIVINCRPVITNEASLRGDRPPDLSLTYKGEDTGV